MSEKNKISRFRQNAELPARAIPLEKLEPGTRKILTEFAPGKTGENLAVACSGGVDSVAALLLVRAHFPALRGKIFVLHFNHGTRPECAREAEFVKKIAGALGEKFVASVIGKKGKSAGNSEDALRRERLAFFRRAMRANKCRILIQGHHAGDVVETALMRLARGSGTAGLCAPRPVQKFADETVFLRPLLLLEKEEISAVLRDAGISWCEDSSNTGEDYLRNRLRKTVVPAWTKAQGGSPANGVLRARKLLEEDDNALETWLDNCFFPGTGKKTPAVFRFDRLKDLPRALHRRALWRVLLETGLEKNIAAPLADEIVDALAGGISGKWSVGKTHFTFDGETLRVAPPKTAPAKPARETLPLPEKTKQRPQTENFTAERLAPCRKKFEEILAGKIPPAREVFFNATAVAGKKITVRPMRPGDAYRPLGAPGTRKLSDIFIDKKIPPEVRRALPVVCDAEGILWIPGLPPAHRCRLQNPGDTPLRLTWLAGNIPFSVPKK